MSVILSKEFGLNASIELCFVCGKDKGIILFGANYRKKKYARHEKAPSAAVYNTSPCNDCKNVLKQGAAFLIEVEDGEPTDNPSRTGRIAVVKTEAIKETFGDMSKSPVIFVEKTVFSKLFANKVFSTESE